MNVGLPNKNNIQNFQLDTERFKRTQVPPINDETVRKICIDHFGLDPERIESMNGYNDRNFRLTNVRDMMTNPNMKMMWPHGYVIKIQCWEDTEVENLIEGQNAVLSHLKAKGLPVQEVVQTKDGTEVIRISVNYAAKIGSEGALNGVHAVRIFPYLPGQLLQSVPIGSDMLYRVGQLMARVHNAMNDFHHPGFDYIPPAIFCLYNFRFVSKLLHVFENEDRRNIVTEVLDAFQTNVYTRMESFQKGQVHGDFFDPNILINRNKDGNFELCGLLDVGETHRTCLIFDVAIGIACMMMLESTTLPYTEIGGHFLAGYISERSIPKRELRILRICICARYCQSLVFGLDIYKRNPANEYALTTQKRGWPQLTALWQMSETEVYATWKRVLSMYGIKDVF